MDGIGMDGMNAESRMSRGGRTLGRPMKTWIQPIELRYGRYPAVQSKSATSRNMAKCGRGPSCSLKDKSRSAGLTRAKPYPAFHLSYPTLRCDLIFRSCCASFFAYPAVHDFRSLCSAIFFRVPCWCNIFHLSCCAIFPLTLLVQFFRSPFWAIFRVPCCAIFSLTLLCHFFRRPAVQFFRMPRREIFCLPCCAFFRLTCCAIFRLPCSAVF